MKILLICSSGMSSSLLGNKIKEAAKSKGIDAEVLSVSTDAADNALAEADVILLAPQIRFMKKRFGEIAKTHNIPVDVIDAKDYGTVNGTGVLQKVLKLLENKKQLKGGIYGLDFEKIIFEIIVHAGNARSNAFEALESAKNGDFENAYNLLKQAKEELNMAHDIQNKLITEEANGKEIPVKLILIHAEDHLMNAILARDLIEEIITFYKSMHK